MHYFYLKISLSLFLLCVTPLLLIRAQPYDDHELRAFLMPEGCELPCFMGIRPGVTTVDEAVRLLKASGWVDEINIRSNTETQVVMLDWNWNGHQPAMLDADFQVTIQASTYMVPGFEFDPNKPLEQQSVVESISLPSFILYGDVRLTLGRGTNRPDYIFVKRYLNSQITAVYSDYKLVAQSKPLTCPVNITEFWNSRIIFGIGYAPIETNGRVSCRRIT